MKSFAKVNAEESNMVVATLLRIIIIFNPDFVKLQQVYIKFLFCQLPLYGD